MNSSLFRGEKVILGQIYFQSEVAYSCVSRLGELGVVQFRDLNPSVNAFQRRFVNEVRRCEEMERKLRYIEKEIVKEAEIALEEGDQTCEAPKQRDMIQLESVLDQLEHDLLEVNSNKDALKKNYLELIELRHILMKASHFFEEADNYNIYNRNQRQLDYSSGGEYSDHEHVTLLMHSDYSNRSRLSIGFIAGILHRDKVPSFELMLWRMCKGNVFLKTAEIEELTEDPQTGALEAKTVFIIFFQGEQLKQKCKKICEGYKATIYPCPETQTERRDMLNGVTSRLEELTTVLDQSLNLRKTLLLNASKNLKTWNCKVTKMKAIFHTINMFKTDQKSMIAECWMPSAETPRIREILDLETKKIDSNFQTIINIMPTKEPPPTYHKLNKVTAGFQNLVNAYGVPNYQEINPAPFAVITFPFLFAIMFGDAGHGIIVLLAALFMVKKENDLKKSIKGNEVFEIFFGGRYIILLMGAFSIYTGLIYNDFYSKSASIFPSSWKVTVGEDFDFSKVTKFVLNPDPNPNTTLNHKMYSGSPYPFGVDPVWQFGVNKISFTNTMKMKFSIIIGVSQMMFGLILGLLNHIHFKRKISIYFEFIPQIIFISFIFVYLGLMIFIKWIKYDGSDSSEHGANCAPNLLIELINMFFIKDSSVNPDGSIDRCKILYPYQHIVQIIFVISAVLCIPVMLLAKPIILYRRHKVQSRLGHRLRDHSGVNNPVYDRDVSNGHSITIEHEGEHQTEDEEEEKFELGEIAVEQTIHTIEYFLGCISHTASYLRLWALSLAHAELSEVVWSMVLRIGLSSNGIIGPFVLFFVFEIWAGISVGILCLMEGLSAFLHALRLHWVEFQSKFYKGEGYEFIPFSFERLLED